MIHNQYIIVNVLFGRGLNLYRDGPFVLMEAVKSGYVGCVESLVRHGVGINETDN